MIDLSGPGAGELRHRITFERRPDSYPTPGPAGDPLDEWEAAGARWASVEQLTGREQVVAAQNGATTTHRIVCRAGLAGIDTSWRIRFRSRTFGIDSVNDTAEVGAFLLIMATERRGDA